jgi:putative transcriptional regulator
VESLRGHLLLSAASLWDPNFRKTIVLIGHHDDEGAVGVVLNRATEVTVEEAVPPLASIVPVDEPLFIGGPVQPQAAVVLADFADPSIAQILALGSIGFLPEEVDPEDVGGIRRARVYSGYSGWGPGQLEAELEEGAWIVEPALPEDVFAPDPDHLWERVLRRKGRNFDLMRTMPVDPSQN